MTTPWTCDGDMQPFALTLDKFLLHAARWRGAVEVSTAHEDGTVIRTGYADLCTRSRRISRLLQLHGVDRGERVATLAWNTQGHLEAWFAIMGMGAVCHTLNPRLTAEQLAAMVIQSGARILLASADLLAQAQQIAALAPDIRCIWMLDQASLPAAAAGSVDLQALEHLLGDVTEPAMWGGFPETAPSGLCFTSGTTGAPKGVTYTHRSSYLHTLRVLQAEMMAITGEDSVLLAVPMFHANAWGLPFAAAAVGASLVLPGRHLDGARLARLIQSEAVRWGIESSSAMVLTGAMPARALAPYSSSTTSMRARSLPGAMTDSASHAGITRSSFVESAATVSHSAFGSLSSSSVHAMHCGAADWTIEPIGSLRSTFRFTSFPASLALVET